MAVRPVTSVNFSVNTRNNITFSGRKDESRKHTSNLRSSVMAVPLATLIAMSPLNAQSANYNNSVFGDESAKVEMMHGTNTLQDGIKRVKNSAGTGELVTVKEGGDSYSLEFVTPKKDGRVTEIRISSHSNASFEDILSGNTNVQTIQELRPVVLHIIGDDGAEGMRVTIEQLMVNEDKIGYSSDKVIKFLKDFAAGKVPGLKNAGALKMGAPIERNVTITNYGNIANGYKNTGWLAEGRAESEDWGRTVMSTNIQTRLGKYTLYAVSTDSNNEDFESLIIKKQGEGEFKVAGLSLVNINLKDNAKIGDFNVGVTSVYKRNSKQTARILDPELFETLWEVTNDTRFNNAYPTKLQHSNMLLFGNGVFSAVN